MSEAADGMDYPPPHASPVRWRLFLRAMAASFAQAIIVILFLVASLVFTGSQAVRTQSALYDALVPFPIVPLPGWLFVVLASFLLPAVIGYAWRAQMLDIPQLLGLLGPVSASVMAAFFFLLAGTTVDDPAFAYALWIDLAALAVLCVPAIRFVREYDRRRRAGELPEGYT